MPPYNREEHIAAVFQQQEAANRAGTEEERRLLATSEGMRLNDAEIQARFRRAHARGMAIDEAHLFADPEMPAFLKEQEPPFYAILLPGALVGEDAAGATRPTPVTIANFPHPDKGPIPVLVPRLPTNPEDQEYSEVLYQAHHPGSQRVRFIDCSCGAYTRCESVADGTFDEEGCERRAYGCYIERKFYDATGTKVIGSRVLNDALLVCDHRDLIAYAVEDGPGVAPSRAWSRKCNDVIGCMYFNAEGAKTHATFTDGRTSMYVGKAGHERQVSVSKDPALHEGVVREFYAGPPGAAYLTRRVYVDGTVKFFTGTTPNFVRLTKIWHPSGKTELYEGEVSRERKVGEGFEPRGITRHAVPSPNLIRGLFAVSRHMLDGHTLEENERACSALMDVAIRDGFVPPDSEINDGAEAIMPVVKRVAGDRYKPLTQACAVMLVVFTAMDPEEALRACQVYEDNTESQLPSATSGKRPSRKLVAFAKTVAELIDEDTSSEEEKLWMREEGARLAQAEGWTPAILRDNSGEWVYCLSEGLGGLDDSVSYTDAQTSHAATIVLFCGSLSFQDAMNEVIAYEADGAASAMDQLCLGQAPAAAEAAPKPLFALPAPEDVAGPKPGTQLRIGPSHRRTDLHGKPIELVRWCFSKKSDPYWVFKWVDPKDEVLAKTFGELHITLAETVTNEEYLAAKAAKEAERAAKAESSKAKKRAQRQAKQLEADARLAAELQAAEEKAAEAPPGPPPEGKQPLKALARCPIDGALLTDAVLCSDGWTYNKGSLQSYWCAREKLVSPITGEPVSNVLLTHYPLRSLAKELQATPSKGDAVPTDEPELVQCPISQEVMASPMLGADGYVYDATTLAQWFATGATTSPMTGAPMEPVSRGDRHMRVLCRAWQ